MHYFFSISNANQLICIAKLFHVLYNIVSIRHIRKNLSRFLIMCIGYDAFISWPRDHKFKFINQKFGAWNRHFPGFDKTKLWKHVVLIKTQLLWISACVNTWTYIVTQTSVSLPFRHMCISPTVTTAVAEQKSIPSSDSHQSWLKSILFSEGTTADDTIT